MTLHPNGGPQREETMTNATLDDITLVRRIQRGDRTALDQLVARHQARAYQYAFRLTRSQDEAADVVADAFVRVFKAIDGFKGDSAFSTWLHRIVTNCYLDRRKKANSRPAVSLDQELALGESEVERQFADPDMTPHDRAVQSQKESKIQEALKRLPEWQRAIVVMYHVDGLAYEEIAEILDLPMGTVKSRLNRARLALRDELAAEQELFLAA